MVYDVTLPRACDGVRSPQVILMLNSLLPVQRSPISLGGPTVGAIDQEKG